AIAAADAAGCKGMGQAVAVAAKLSVGDDRLASVFPADQRRTIRLDGGASIDAGAGDVEPRRDRPAEIADRRLVAGRGLEDHWSAAASGGPASGPCCASPSSGAPSTRAQ